jgi:excisionase family DNA binding protein
MGMMETLLRADELALALNVKLSTIRRWTYERRIPCVRIGRRAVRYRLQDVERVLLRNQPAIREG